MDSKAATGIYRSKKLMSKAGKLAHPDFTREFILQSDASELAIGGVLSQENKMIGYFSRALSGTEARYAITEEEVIALVESLEHFKPFCLGYKTICKTDQRNVKLLLTREFSTKFFRYHISCSVFNPVIQFIPGKESKSDWLSRCSHFEETLEDDSANHEKDHISQYCW